MRGMRGVRSINPSPQWGEGGARP
ncbi:MAG: hypothetical protein QOH86_202, partial [Sphingomonadales bacterium]|nr:hypothetical protein [Sphingomonadales bacterium]